MKTVKLHDSNKHYAKAQIYKKMCTKKEAKRNFVKEPT